MRPWEAAQAGQRLSTCTATGQVLPCAPRASGPPGLSLLPPPPPAAVAHAAPRPLVFAAQCTWATTSTTPASASWSARLRSTATWTAWSTSLVGAATAAATSLSRWGQHAVQRAVSKHPGHRASLWHPLHASTPPQPAAEAGHGFCRPARHDALAPPVNQSSPWPPASQVPASLRRLHLRHPDARLSCACPDNRPRRALRRCLPCRPRRRRPPRLRSCHPGHHPPGNRGHPSPPTLLLPTLGQRPPRAPALTPAPAAHQPGPRAHSCAAHRRPADAL